MIGKPGLTPGQFCEEDIHDLVLQTKLLAETPGAFRLEVIDSQEDDVA